VARRPEAALELDLSYAARRPWVPRRAQLRAWVSAALAAQGGARLRRAKARANGAARADAAVVAVSISIVGAARSRALNLRYRGKDRPTNVLSFGGAGPLPDGRLSLGEIVICAPVVAREARVQSKSAEAHWAHLSVHGVLHLLGFDHERRGEARKMEAREIQILDRLGFSNPYS
jgi:probable rRNA maturation factor